MSPKPRSVPTSLVSLERPEPPLRRALSAIEELVEEAVRSKSVTRFGDAARICAVGTQLQSATAKGVLDDPTLGGLGGIADPYGCNVPQVGRVYNPVMGGLNFNVRGDGMQNQMDMMQTIQQMLGPLGAGLSSSQRAQELDRLQDVLRTAKGRTRRVVRMRIATIVDEIETETFVTRKREGHERHEGEENGSGDTLDSDVVHPEFLRRRAPGGGPNGSGARGDDPRRSEPHADRRGGDGDPAEARDREAEEVRPYFDRKDPVGDRGRLPTDRGKDLPRNGSQSAPTRSGFASEFADAS